MNFKRDGTKLPSEIFHLCFSTSPRKDLCKQLHGNNTVETIGECMSNLAEDTRIVIENYEEYFGTAEEVQEKISRCKVCGEKLLINHLPDYKNLILQENSRCLKCDSVHQKKIHIIN